MSACIHAMHEGHVSGAFDLLDIKVIERTKEMLKAHADSSNYIHYDLSVTRELKNKQKLVKLPLT